VQPKKGMFLNLKKTFAKANFKLTGMKLALEKAVKKSNASKSKSKSSSSSSSTSSKSSNRKVSKSYGSKKSGSKKDSKGTTKSLVKSVEKSTKARMKVVIADQKTKETSAKKASKAVNKLNKLHAQSKAKGSKPISIKSTKGNLPKGVTTGTKLYTFAGKAYVRAHGAGEWKIRQEARAVEKKYIQARLLDKEKKEVAAKANPKKKKVFKFNAQVKPSIKKGKGETGDKKEGKSEGDKKEVRAKARMRSAASSRKVRRGGKAVHMAGSSNRSGNSEEEMGEDSQLDNADLLDSN